MDEFLKKEESKKTIAETVNEVKKIEFKQIKEGKHMLTFILNLDSFIKDEKILAVVIKNLKKLLGTACVKKDTNFGPGYGFGGDFSEKIKNFLISNTSVTKDDFK
jgi:hypothetical protein